MAAAGAATGAQREARGAAEEGPAPQARTVEGAEPGLTEEQLMEVFKQTSIFNVRSAMAGNEALLGPEVDAAEDDRRAKCRCAVAVLGAPVATQRQEAQPAPGASRPHCVLVNTLGH